MSSVSKSLSIVIPALNEAAHLERTVRQFQSTAPDGSEIVVVDDGSTDGCADFVDGICGNVHRIRTARQGAARARNLGALHSSGKVILFADGHVDPMDGWWQPVMAALECSSVGAVAPGISIQGKPAVKGFGFRLTDIDLRGKWLPKMGTGPYTVPMLPGAFLAMRRDVFVRTGGFDDGLHQYGFNDAEISLRLWLLGYELLIVPQIAIPHYFRTASPYTRDGTHYLHNLLRVALVHFNPDRSSRVVAKARTQGGFSAAMALIAGSDVESRRASLLCKRVRDDDWFFNTLAVSS